MTKKHAKLRETISAIVFSFSLSWNASPVFLLLRSAIAVANACLPLFSLFLSRELIDVITVLPADGFSRAIWLLILLAVTNIVLLIAGRILQYIQPIHDEIMGKNLRIRLIDKGTTLDVDSFDSPEYMDAMQSAQTDSLSLQNMVWNTLYCFSSLLSLVSAFIVLAAENWLYAVLLVLSDIPFVLSNQKYAKENYQWFLDHISEERQTSYIQSVALNRRNAFDVRLYNMKPFLIQKYTVIWQTLIQGKKALLKRQNIMLCVYAILPEICTLGISIGIIRQIFTLTMTLGDYTLLAGLMTTLTSGLSAAATAITNIYSDKLKVEHIKEFYNIPPSVPDKGAVVLNQVNTIDFRHVSFRYPGTQYDVIHDLTFHIRKGERICLVGSNGSGKSTIIKLLLRYYDVSSGELLINDTPIGDYTLESLRNAFTSLFQQYDVFAFSLRENVTLSESYENPVANNNKIIESLEEAGGEKILEKCNHNLDIGLSKQFAENGLELSGGETQKIALARALYRHRSVAIFDEPTSAFDAVAEKAFFSQLVDRFAGQTILFTTHRMTTVHIATRILVIENGYLVEDGTHEDLLKRNGVYAQLYNAQTNRNT